MPESDLTPWLQPQRGEIEALLQRGLVLVAELRPSRRRAKRLAVLELLQRLAPWQARFIRNGPFGEVRGLLSLLIRPPDADGPPRYAALSEEARRGLAALLEGIGYCRRFYLLDFDAPDAAEALVPPWPGAGPPRWKRLPFALHALHAVDEARVRAEAPDRRSFVLLGEDGVARTVQGYRGDGSAMGRRALPVEDARLLVNLACGPGTRRLLEPFAGGGGIVYQARRLYPDAELHSLDIAPELAAGLRAYGALHQVGDAAQFSSALRFDALATELPFGEAATPELALAVARLQAVLTDTSRQALMCAPYQAAALRRALEETGAEVSPALPLDRKGSAVSILLAFRRADAARDFARLWEGLEHYY